ncbi:MAG: hypothetical protein NC116_10525 [Clostridium sp.]|nr:hypothetical protein [Clostridium sp.]
MPIRTNTNPRPLELTPELQDILRRNGIQGHVVASSNGFGLMVQGHDSPLLQYSISEKQLKVLTDWGTNSANRKAYNTFASIVAADFDMPKDFVHARNANGRVAMGLHGYRIGVGEYGRIAPHIPQHRHGPMPYMPIPHMMGYSFLGWTPRQQAGFHLRRIGGQLYYPGAPMVPDRPDGRMKPGELQSGAYGFYYKGHTTAPVAQGKDVLADLQTVLQPTAQRERPVTPAIPYNQAVTSEVYFSNEKWQEVLASHGLIVDADKKTLTVQSSAIQADLQYNLSDNETAILTSNSIKESPIAQRLDTLNAVLSDDFADKITMEQLNSDKLIEIKLHPEVNEDLNRQLGTQEQYIRQFSGNPDVQVHQKTGLRDNLPQGGVVMDGNDLAYIDSNKGWFREGKHGREVTVDDIRVEPVPDREKEGNMKYRMTAVIDGETVSHEISRKQYDKFMAIDDLHRMKLFSKIFSEVDMKDRYPVGLGTKIATALTAGLVVTHDIMHGPHHAPAVFMEGHPGPGPKVYFKPGVDTPADVAARQFDTMINDPNRPHGPGMGM